MSIVKENSMMIMGPVYDNGTSLVVAAVVVVFVDSCV